MTPEFLTMIATSAAAIIAAFALINTYLSQRESLRRQRKQATIEAFNQLQNDVLDPLAGISKKEAELAAERHFESDADRDIYNAFRVQIARLEHFAVGINEETYDFDTFYKLGGVHVMFLYERVEPIIEESRQNSSAVVPYQAFEELYLRIKEEYTKQKEGLSDGKHD